MTETATATLSRRIDLLLRTGCLLMESAADTPRTLRTMKRVAAWLAIPAERLQIHVDFDMLTVNYDDTGRPFTKIRRVERHGVNLDAIREVSHLSWEAIRHNFSTTLFEQTLEDIRHRHNYHTWQVAAGGGLACGGFCIQFGGDWAAFLYASLAAMTGLALRSWLNRRGMNTYVNIAIAAFVSTLIAWLLGLLSLSAPSALHSATPWHPLMACALFIVPGVPLINFVSDMLSGYTSIGITRAANTLMMLLAMAFGIAFFIKLLGVVPALSTVGEATSFVHNLPMVPHHNYNEYMLAAAIAAVGFSMIFNVPRRLLPVVALGGIVAICTRNIVSLGASSGNVGLDFGPVVGSFVGSAVVSMLCCTLVHRLHTPHQCLSIPSVIPMIPGVLMYRALFAFIDMRGVVGEVTVAVNNAVTASLIILCIALGVAIPNIFFRRMINPKREQKLMDMLLYRRMKQHGE